MAEKLSEHPIMVYATLIMPLVLLLLAIIINANLFFIMALLAWLGVAFIVLFIPVSSDNGSSG